MGGLWPPVTPSPSPLAKRTAPRSWRFLRRATGDTVRRGVVGQSDPRTDEILAAAFAARSRFLVLPRNEVRRLRRDNIILQTFPVLIDGMPPAKVAAEITKLLAYLRGGR